jgi:hypothetical protein
MGGTSMVRPATTTQFNRHDSSATLSPWLPDH